MKRALAVLLTAAMAMELSISTALAQSPDEVARADQAWHIITVDSVTPRSGSEDIEIQPQLSMVFGEAVSKGKGHIAIKKRSGETVETIAVDSDQVRLDDKQTKAVITPSVKLDYRTTYTVQVDYGTFTSEKGEFLGIYDPTVWSFTTKAEQGIPMLEQLVPARGQKDVRVDANLALTFNEPVWRSEGSILIKTAKDGKVYEAVSASSNRISGEGTRTITIDPVLDLKPDTEYIVEITAGALRNGSKQAYPGLQGDNAWRFATGKQDVTAPVLLSASMQNADTIRLTYNEALDPASIPPASRFSVTVNGDSRSIANVAVAGSTVDVKLKNGIAYGQVVRISYTPGKDRNIQDAAGNAAAALDRTPVSDTTDATLPKLQQVTAKGSQIVFEFNKDLDAVSSKAADQFTVWVDGKTRAITRISQDGRKVTLSLLHLITNGQVVKMRYAPDRYPLQDRAGHPVPAISEQYVRNLNDTKPPVLEAAEVKGSVLRLVYNEGLKADQVPHRSHYSVLVNRTARYVQAVQIRGNVVELVLDSSVSDHDEVTVSYAPADPRLTDLSGNAAAAFTLAKVANKTDNEVPVLRSASVKGASVTLTFSEKLRESPAPAPSQFSVQADGAGVRVKSASVKGDKVTLALDESVNPYSTVTVSYAPGTNPLRDLNGNAVSSFANAAAANETDGSVRPGDIQPASHDWFLDSGWYVLSSSAADTASDRSRYGQSVKRYTLPASKLKSSFEYVIKNGTRNHLAFDVPVSEHAAMVAVPLSALKEVYNKASDAVFSIRYGAILYSVPLRELDFSRLEREWGGSAAYLLLQAEKPTGADANALTSYLQATGANIRVQPVDFYASTYAGSASPRALEAQLEYKVRTTGYVDSGNASAVRYDAALAKAGFVPTVMKQEAGVTVFGFQFKGNQAVAMMDRSKDFQDIRSHWAREAIRELASKYIIEGVSSTAFAPNANITRAQFATLLARSLGLQGDPSAAAGYRDVSTSGKLAPYIGAATKAGIIGGFEDRTFRPNESINREQMAVMLVRAMDYTGYAVTADPGALNKFMDRNKIGRYAVTGVGKAVTSGIVQGMTSTTFDPKGTATRAQAAAMLKRMLQQINYLG
ncbi:SwmB domain-containing protein [Paenibacillus thiaminolyticus]|uniref:SwmB domain-containing protein n=1 Tax=Paenibacillus thiaminolyticus TaxID=49283 RepID=UPI003D2E39A9